MNIRLRKMTKSLCREYFQQFSMDPAMFTDPSTFKPYIYSPEKADETVERYELLGRIYMAIILYDEPIGEVILKNIDWNRKCCTLGIHMKNDLYKNKGYGTQAEVLILRYAFEVCGMDVVYADAIHSNLRSRHVLEKAGFRQTSHDNTFVYYECRKDTWSVSNF